MARSGRVEAIKMGNAWLYNVESRDVYIKAMSDAGHSKHDPRRNPAWERSPEAGRKRKTEE